MSRIHPILLPGAIFVFLLWSCEKNPVQSGLPDDQLLGVRTLTQSQPEGVTYRVPPQFGHHTKLYLGPFQGYSCDYVLIQFAKTATNHSSLSWAKLLESDSLVVDSVYLELGLALDSGATAPTVEGMLFSQVGDSIFSETRSTHLNFTESNFLQGSSFGNGDFVRIPPDTGQPFYRWDFASLDSTFIDSSSSRTVGFRLVNPGIDSVKIFSRESATPPRILVSYRTLDTSGEAVDTTTVSFTAVSDLTIVTPPDLSTADEEYLTVSAGLGLKSVISLDLAWMDTVSSTLVFDKAQLRLFLADTNFTGHPSLQMVPLKDTVAVTPLQEFPDDAFQVESGFLVEAEPNGYSLTFNLKPILQSIRQEVLPNLGLKLQMKNTSRPFDRLHFLTDSTRLEVRYVQGR
ncbi:MAG: hypothetical protein D6762_08315 [Candidatus Neomarinimicrobiota bacterium]|nr:MAG: hypothetical protein D6762_08315 [Candidatus Neomarinimicrobiota bacterium]